MPETGAVAGDKLLDEKLKEPGSVRIDLQVYLGSPSRAYRSVPGYSTYAKGVTAAEARRLSKKLREVIAGDSWRKGRST